MFLGHSGVFERTETPVVAMATHKQSSHVLLMPMAALRQSSHVPRALHWSCLRQSSTIPRFPPRPGKDKLKMLLTGRFIREFSPWSAARVAAEIQRAGFVQPRRRRAPLRPESTRAAREEPVLGVHLVTGYRSACGIPRRASRHPQPPAARCLHRAIGTHRSRRCGDPGRAAGLW